MLVLHWKREKKSNNNLTYALYFGGKVYFLKKYFQCQQFSSCEFNFIESSFKKRGGTNTHGVDQGSFLKSRRINFHTRLLEKKSAFNLHKKLLSSMEMFFYKRTQQPPDECVFLVNKKKITYSWQWICKYFLYRFCIIFFQVFWTWQSAHIIRQNNWDPGERSNDD